MNYVPTQFSQDKNVYHVILLFDNIAGGDGFSNKEKPELGNRAEFSYFIKNEFIFR